MKLVIIREHYLAIADGDHCIAALLNWFEQWTNTKLDELSQDEIRRQSAKEAGELIDSMHIWIYAGHEELSHELMGLFGERKIADALKWLCDIGFIEKRHNPNHAWDRKLQYLMDVEWVQLAIDEIAECMLQNCGIDNAKTQRQRRKKAPAIPKNTSNNTNQDTKVGRKSNPIFDAVAKHLFDIADTSNVNGKGGRIGKVASVVKSVLSSQSVDEARVDELLKRFADSYRDRQLNPPTGDVLDARLTAFIQNTRQDAQPKKPTWSSGEEYL